MTVQSGAESRLCQRIRSYLLLPRRQGETIELVQELCDNSMAQRLGPSPDLFVRLDTERGYLWMPWMNDAARLGGPRLRFERVALWEPYEPLSWSSLFFTPSQLQIILSPRTVS